MRLDGIMQQIPFPSPTPYTLGDFRQMWLHYPPADCASILAGLEKSENWLGGRKREVINIDSVCPNLRYFNSDGERAPLSAGGQKDPLVEYENEKDRFVAAEVRVKLDRKAFVTGAGKTLALLPLAARCKEAAEAGSSLIIDCQSHLFVPKVVALMEKRKQDRLVYRKGTDNFVQMGPWNRRIMPKHTDVDA